VEVARVAAAAIGVRDSKDVIGSPVLHFRQQEWRSFLDAVRTGRLDLA
jgi:hypothetical protein